MEWVSGVGRDESGQPCLEAQWLDGPRTWTDLASLKPDLGVKGTVRRRVDLDLAVLQPIDPAGYLHGLGLQTLDARAQRVYEADTAAGTVLVPSQLLVLAIFGASRPLREVLLRPWGPTCLMNAVVRGERLEVAPAPNRMFKLEVGAPALIARMAWVLSHPSATAAWSSVHANALAGRFDMRMPKAVAGLSLHGKVVGDKLLVTQLQVLELTATEAPFEFAADCAPRHFVFDERVHVSNMHGKAAAPAADASIATDGRVVPLTDEQWARIEPLLAGVVGTKGCGTPRRHSLRELVKCIRLKLGAPYSWSKCPGDKSLVQSASVLLSKLQRAGVWASVCRAVV
jgi:hypothetical protein